MWILLRSPPCHAPRASQGFAIDDDEGIKGSSWQAVHLSLLTTTSAAEEDVTTASELFVIFSLLSFLKTLKTFILDLFNSKGRFFSFADNKKTSDSQIMTTDAYPTNEKMIFNFFLVQPTNTVKGLQILQCYFSLLKR